MRTLEISKRLAWAILLANLVALPATGEPLDPDRHSGTVALKVKKVTGPFVYHNLAVYLVHGEDQLPRDVDLTVLEPALAQKKLVVRETKNVNRLVVENRSTDYVFLQAGDIVSGGWQDRVIAFDLVVPPRSGKVAISAFCVESGRWSGRGGESERVFGGAEFAASGKKLKRAYRDAKSQSEVWTEVRAVQEELSASLATNVSSAQSRTSMALTLENQAVDQIRTRYARTLMDAVDGKSDVVGFAFVREPSSTGRAEHQLAEFYIKPESRRLGIGRRAAAAIWQRFPGKWEFQVHARNSAALEFWASCAEVAAGEAPRVHEIEGPDGRRMQFSFQIGQTS